MTFWELILLRSSPEIMTQHMLIYDFYLFLIYLYCLKFFNSLETWFKSHHIFWLQTIFKLKLILQNILFIYFFFFSTLNDYIQTTFNLINNVSIKVLVLFPFLELFDFLSSFTNSNKWGNHCKVSIGS